MSLAAISAIVVFLSTHWAGSSAAVLASSFLGKFLPQILESQVVRLALGWLIRMFQCFGIVFDGWAKLGWFRFVFVPAILILVILKALFEAFVDSALNQAQPEVKAMAAAVASAVSQVGGSTDRYTYNTMKGLDDTKSSAVAGVAAILAKPEVDMSNEEKTLAMNILASGNLLQAARVQN